MAARPRIRPGSTVGEAVPRTVGSLVGELLAHEGAARRGEAEKGIHDLRVATKRLREATRMFGPALAKGRREKRLARLEVLNEALGDVRDADVALHNLARSRSHAAATVARSVRRQRARAQARLVEALDRFDSAREPAKLRKLAKRAGHGAELSPDAPVEALAREALDARLERLESRVTKAATVPDAAALHALRIAAKKARYALEPFRELLPNGFDSTFRELEELQNELGDLHDAEVLGAHVLRELARAKAHDRRGLLTFLAAVESRRHAAILPLLSHLQRLTTERVLPSAREAVSAIGAAHPRTT